MKLTLLDLSEAKSNVRASAARPTVTFSDPEGWVEMFSGLKTSSGQIVSREKALRCSAFLACARILMEDIGSLPLITKRKTAQGADDALEHPLYKILKSAPNPLQTSFELRERLVLDMLMHGKFFNYVVRDGAARVKAIYSLDAGVMTLGGMNPETGAPYWNGSDPNFPNKTRWEAHELWRGTMFNTRLVDGRALMLLAREAIGLAIAAEEQGARLFSNGIQTDIVFKTAGELAPQDKIDLRNGLQETYGGSKNSWRALLLENGIDVAKIGLTAQESQYIEARQYQLADIARMTRIPGVMVGIPDTATYASASEFFQSYVKHAIRPWDIRIVQTAERDLILDGVAADHGIFFKHKLSDLLKGDQQSRFEGYTAAILGGYMQPAEARQEEDWNEIPGLNVTWRPANYVVVGQEGATTPTQSQDAKTDPHPLQYQQRRGGKAAKAELLAASIAASILKSETREFTRRSRNPEVTAAKTANFAAWHVAKVADLTGAPAEAVAAYSEWRFANPNAETEARERLINLCLEEVCL